MSFGLLISPKEQAVLDNIIREAKCELIISRQAIPNFEYCNTLLNAKKNGIKIRILGSLRVCVGRQKKV